MRRIMREAKELQNATDQYHAAPLEDNIFEWHFTIAGPQDTPFEGGRFHGRLILPTDYPMKPPNIIIMTPNGRFEVGKKICLTISAHHPESWQPSWSIRTMLMAIQTFLITPGNGAIGALDYNDEERKELARRSVAWKCPTCDAHMSTILDDTCKSVDMSTAEKAAFEEMQKMGFSAPRSRTATESSKSASPAQPAATQAPAPAPNPPVRAPRSRTATESSDAGPPAKAKVVPPPVALQAVPEQGWSGTIAILGVVMAIGFFVYRKLNRTAEERAELYS